MKRIIQCLLAAVLLLLAGCGKTAADAPTEQTMIAADVTLPADLSAVTAAETLDGDDVTCELLERDGEAIGFEMRFLQSARLDALFADPENMYYGVADCGKEPIGIPMEQVRILTDDRTHEFVLTLLLPSGGKLSGSACAVAFYTAARSSPAENALFCARQEISLP